MKPPAERVDRQGEGREKSGLGATLQGGKATIEDRARRLGLIRPHGLGDHQQVLVLSRRDGNADPPAPPLDLLALRDRLGILLLVQVLLHASC